MCMIDTAWLNIFLTFPSLQCNVFVVKPQDIWSFSSVGLWFPPCTVFHITLPGPSLRSICVEGVLGQSTHLSLLHIQFCHMYVLVVSLSRLCSIFPQGEPFTKVVRVSLPVWFPGVHCRSPFLDLWHRPDHAITFCGRHLRACGAVFPQAWLLHDMWHFHWPLLCYLVFLTQEYIPWGSSCQPLTLKWGLTLSLWTPLKVGRGALKRMTILKGIGGQVLWQQMQRCLGYKTFTGIKACEWKGEDERLGRERHWIITQNQQSSANEKGSSGANAAHLSHSASGQNCPIVTRLPHHMQANPGRPWPRMRQLYRWGWPSRRWQLHLLLKGNLSATSPCLPQNSGPNSSNTWHLGF